MTLDPPRDDNPTSVRLAHLRVESDIKSVGQLCYLATFFSALGTLEFLLFALEVIPHDTNIHQFASPDQVRVFFWILTGFMIVNTIAQGALGFGLTHLQSWARWTAVALTGLSLVSGVGLGLAFCFTHPLWGLLGLMVGTAIHALILYPLLTPAASLIFSRPYRQVIRATPEIRSRMHPLLKLFIASLFAGLVGLAIWIAFWVIA